MVERLDLPGRLFVRNVLPEQHRDFHAQLHFFVPGSVDAKGDAWATARAGVPGFLRSPDPRTLHVAAGSNAADPADAGMGNGDAIGLLGIDPFHRRRNRLNGTVVRADGGDGFDIRVGQSFGNCPQYIQVRSPEFTCLPVESSPAPVQESTAADGWSPSPRGTGDWTYAARRLAAQGAGTGVRRMVRKDDGMAPGNA